MDWIQAQRALSDKDLAIFNAELQRRSKSTALAYVLWFLLGGVGVHNFYMGKVYWGLLYLVLGVFGWFFFWPALSLGSFLQEPRRERLAHPRLGFSRLEFLGCFCFGTSSQSRDRSLSGRKALSKSSSPSLELLIKT